jgi:subtilisin
MSRRVLAVLGIGLLWALSVVVTPAGAAKTDRYIVVLEQNAGPPGQVASRQASKYDATVDFVYRHALKGWAGTLRRSDLDDLRADPSVAYVTADRPVSVSQEQPSQVLPTGIDRVDGELSSAASGDGAGETDVDVAVIDTGIDPHPDLDVVGGTNCLSGGSGTADANGHGTHVAGTAAAKDDGIGVVGVAPGARLSAVRVLSGGGSGSFASVICGVDFVTANADTIEVANMSLSGGGADDGNCGLTNNDPLHTAICNSVDAGVTYAVAAGNAAADAANRVPAAYNEVITVSALADFDGQPGGAAGDVQCNPGGSVESDDTFAFFSNFGSDIDVIAPGVCILSTWKNSGYNEINGTSMATPHAAGAAALFLSGRPTASPQQVRNALRSNGTFNYDGSEDPDGIKEPLVNVAEF